MYSATGCGTSKISGTDYTVTTTRKPRFFHLLTSERMIARRDYINTRRKHLFRGLRRDSVAVSGIFSVRYYQSDIFGRTQRLYDFCKL
jgi:hypothetical protein